MVKVVWTEISIFDLKEIFEYIAEDSKRFASITTQKIYQRAQEIILTHMEAGLFRNSIKKRFGN
jgi:hypothetical protein